MTSQGNDRQGIYRWLVLLVVVGLLVVIGFTFRNSLDLENLASREQDLREWVESNPVLAFVGALVLYVAVAWLSIPGAAILSIVCAWAFGFPLAILLVSFASTLGATLAFLTSRYLLQDMVRRWLGDRLTKFDRAFANHAAWFLLTLRLLPAFPYFVINIAMGLTPMRVWTYWWASQLGMLPGTIAYVYFGSTLPSLQRLQEEGASAVLSPSFFIALTILAVLPWGVRWAFRSLKISLLDESR